MGHPEDRGTDQERPLELIGQDAGSRWAKLGRDAQLEIAREGRVLKLGHD